MKNIKKSLALTLFCVVGSGICLHAQTIYKIGQSKNNDMKMSGTSSLHNWSMSSKHFDGDAEFVFKPGDDRDLTSVKSLNFSLPATDLKSGENGLDKNAYKALKTKEHKDISYKLTSATVTPEKDNRYLLKTHGELSISGVTKEITMDVHCVVNSDKSVTFTGSDKLKMSDYSVKGPTFMVFMKTGDDLTLDFTAVYSK